MIQITFAIPSGKNVNGSLAQLVQSICLTSRGSGVRIPQLPHQVPIISGLFSFTWDRGSPVILRDQLPHQVPKKFEFFGAFFMPFFQRIDIEDGRLQRGSDVIVGGNSELLE